MSEETKNQIKEILMVLYGIPGQYAILAIVSFALGKSFVELTNMGNIFYLLGVFFVFLEIVSPIVAGLELYDKARENINHLFG